MMDTAVQTALTTALTSFKTDALSQLASVLPQAMLVTVSVAVLFLGIRLFRSIAHV